VVSKASELFPEPEMPVNTMSLPRGRSSVTFLRLCSRAPWITSLSVPIRDPLYGPPSTPSGGPGRGTGRRFPGSRSPMLLGMQRDIRGTAVFREIEEFFERALGPAFGRISGALDVAPSPDGSLIAFTGTRLEKLEGTPTNRVCV